MHSLSTPDIASLSAHLDSLLAEPSAPLAAQPQPVQHAAVPLQTGRGRPPQALAPRTPQNDPRIMRFDEFRRLHPRPTLDAAGLKRYQSLCTQASQARRHLEKHPVLVRWYDERERLDRQGLDMAAAGPMPTTPAGRAWHRQKALADARTAAHWHQFMMTCDLPDPALVRPGERSLEAMEEKRDAHKRRQQILRYRKEHEADVAAQQQLAENSNAQLDDPTITPAQRRAARTNASWLARLQEDERWLIEHDLSVSCERPTQPLPLARRKHRAQS